MTREELLNKMKVRLDGWNENMEELDARMKDVGDAAREKYEEQRVVLREKYRELELKMEQIQNSTDDLLVESKEDIDNFFDAFGAAVNEFRSHLK